MRPIAIALMLAVMLLTFAGQADAFRPTTHAEQDEWTIDQPASYTRLFERFVRSEEQIDLGLAEFQARVGGRWAIQRDPVTDAPHMILGSGVAYTESRVENEDRAVALSRSFLGEHADILMLDPDRLGEPHVVHKNGKWSIVFPESHEGVYVHGGRAHVVMTEEGRIYAIGSDLHPGISVDLANVIDEAEAIAVAKNNMFYMDGQDFMREEPEFLIQPVRSGNSYVYRPTWKVIVHTQEPFGGWQHWVDANTGEIYARENTYERLDVIGTVRGDIEEPTYCDGDFDLPLKEMNIRVPSGTGTATDADGNFLIPDVGTDTVLISTQFRGPWFREFHITGTASTDTFPWYPGDTLDYRWNDSNSLQSERDVWRGHWQIRDFMEELDSSLTANDYQMPLNIERTDGFCPGNAWWDGWSTNYCKGSVQNANTGLLGDVMYHEYGHGINQWTYAGMPFSGPQSEGNADVATIMVLHRPTLGIGFNTNACNIGIRSANMGEDYPADTNGGSHHDGQFISGFSWELRTRLITTYGAAYTDSILPYLWHYSRKSGKPSNMQDQVTWFFIYDDDDGNLDNGTPNFTELAGAATEIGFVVPTITEGVHITHAGLNATTDDLNSRTVVATAVSLSDGIDPTSVALHYRVDGGSYTIVPMTPTGGTDEYSADIPASVEGTLVEYFIDASDSSFNQGSNPTNAVTAPHGYEVVLLYDDCEALGGWTLGDVSDDATKGIWINADPVGNDTRPEDDSSPEGISCFVTGNTGNVRNGKTTLYSPAYQLNGAGSVIAKYRRWYTNNFDATGVLQTLDEYWDADASDDGGANWTPIEHVGNGTESWIDVEVDLGALFGAVDSVQFRFVARDTGAPTRVHAAVDDVRFLIPASIATSVEGATDESPGAAPMVYRLKENRPNPFNPVTRIAYELPRKSPVTLSVFDLTGRRVKTLVSEVQGTGRHEVLWNGTNDAGRSVSSGVYFYKLESNSFSKTRKMMLVK